MISAAPDTAKTATDAPSDAWFTRPKLVLLLFFFAALAFPTVLLGTNSLVYRDMGHFGYPLALFHKEAFWQGELPFWNPYNNFGLPFLAQWNTLVLYPGSLIYLLLPLPWSLNLFVFLHLFVGALGMYALAYRWTGNRFAASVGGLVFAWNGLTLHALMWPNNIAALGWFPWVLLAMERSWLEGGRRVALGALAGAMQMLTGAPEIILLTWLVVGVLWLREVLRREVKWPRLLGRTLVTGVLVFGVCAAQLLPFLDLLLQSQRDSGFGGAAWSMPLWGWANFLMPLFGCTPSVVGVYSQDAQQWTASYYLGGAALGMALLGLRARDGRVKWLAAMALAGAVLALGEAAGVYAVLKKVIPLLGFIRFPIKYVVLVIFMVPLLAAFGASTLADPNRKPSTQSLLLVFGGLLVAIVMLAVWAKFQSVGGASGSVVLTNAFGRTAFLIGIFLVFYFSLIRKSLKPRLGFAIVLLLMGADVLWHAPSLNPVAPIRAFGPVTFKMSERPAVGQGRAMVAPPMERALSGLGHPDPETMFVGHRRMLLSDCNLIDRIPKVNGFFSLYLRDADELLRQVYRNTNYALPLLDFLSVTQISDESELFVWHARTNALPWVSAGQEPQFVGENGTLKAVFDPNFAPAKTVVLPTAAKPLAEVHGGKVTLRNQQVTRERMTCEVTAAAPAVVVFSQAYSPSWRAFVDGKPVPLLKANHAFQAVVVPAGTHQVSIVYRERTFVSGAVLSALSVVACVAVAFRRRSTTSAAVPT